MAYQAVFKRWELKYMVTLAQKQRLLAAMDSWMVPDKYGRTTIRNLYFDTPDYRLIRRSIERPVYKEKLRIRSYAQAESDSNVFVELKKKFNGIVYKRRLSMTEQQARNWLRPEGHAPVNSQIAREIGYFMDFYGQLQPTVFLSYDREAYFCPGGDFRVTFDDNILVRRDALSLRESPWGTAILPDGYVLMEIKCAGGIPLRMTEILTREHIYKTSFSKYGTAYRELIFPNETCKGAIHHA